MNSQYKRVNRYRTCLICGKPDWCSYTADGKVSFCARISLNADRISRTGWGVFYHENPLFGSATLPFPAQAPPKKPEIAPIEIRDFVYRKLIVLSPATESAEIINSPKGLRSRKILDFENYGSLPQKQNERQHIAKIVRHSICRQFPEYVRTKKCSVEGVPGFWFNKKGEVQLWLEKDFSCPMMLIPYHDEIGCIQACQIRVMETLQNRPQRYFWLSTPEKSNGVKCGSPLHFVSRIVPQCQNGIWVTEGVLKAETAQIFHPEVNLVALSSVSSPLEELIRIARSRPLRIAFDSDFQANNHVARHLGNLIKRRLLDSRLLGYSADVKILFWSPKHKGIDDALLHHEVLLEKTPFEWFKSLNAELRREVGKTFKFSIW